MPDLRARMSIIYPVVETVLVRHDRRPPALLVVTIDVGVRHYLEEPRAGVPRKVSDGIQTAIVAPLSEGGGHIRITSYNVCYTKLLR